MSRDISNALVIEAECTFEAFSTPYLVLNRAGILAGSLGQNGGGRDFF